MPRQRLGAGSVAVSEATFGELTQVTFPGEAAQVDEARFDWTIPSILPNQQPVPDGQPLHFTLTVTQGNPVTTLTRTLDSFVGDGPQILDFAAPDFATVGTNLQIGWVKFEGQSVSSLYVSSNGWISKTSPPASNPSPKTLPNTSTQPIGGIAPFWDDLVGNGGGANSKVVWQQFDPDGVANSGDEYTLVSWENWARSGQTTSLNFQVKFMEATGNIEFHYGPMTGPADYTTGKFATAWIEHSSGKSAMAISTLTPNSIQPNTSYRFTWSP
jgi:hypothetical protein